MEFNELNYYQILEVSSDATQEEIKKAYRRQVKKYHPDLNHDISSTKQMQMINEAYEVLSDVTLRKQYDKTINNSKNNKAYTSYTKTRDESESDLDDWLREYLRRRRNLNKLYKSYAKVEEHIISLRRDFIKPHYEDVIKSQLLLQAIKIELYSLFSYDFKNPARILEALFSELEISLNLTFTRKSNFVSDIFADEIIMNLILFEIKLVLDKYTDKNGEYYNSFMKFILEKYIELSMKNDMRRKYGYYIKPSDQLIEELLTKVLKDNKEYIKEYLKKFSKKHY